ncbi:MAG: glycosyltransferase [Candidatus Omnitrophica bacterium]|nr:glycosyltransferase [Candidatus Omnitrophota bacterium]
MKILMQNRINAFSEPGGDTIQMLKTKEYLEKIGCEVVISCDLDPDLDGIDIVHLFNITRINETYMQFKNAQKQNKPVVVSSIYQNFEELDSKASSVVKGFLWRLLNKENREKIKTLGRTIRNPGQTKSAVLQMIRGFKNEQIEVLSGASLILPNSLLEAKAIQRDFSLNIKYEIVSNAVDAIFAQKNNSFINNIGWNNYVLCVGNFIERKNQLALIEAMQELNIPLILIGSKANTHKNYFNRINLAVKNSAGQIKIMKNVPQSELIPIYSGAKVVVLPSWIETTGLSCLEGAIAGCNIVITDRGYTKEYFQDMAYYCNPADIQSIKNAIIKAFNALVSPDLKTHILSNYTWEKTAELTFKAYSKALNIEKQNKNVE